MKDKMLDKINGYLTTYSTNEASAVSRELLVQDLARLEACSDFIIDLFCKIGLQENFEPNETGFDLEACLEYLNQIRSQYHEDT